MTFSPQPHIDHRHQARAVLAAVQDVSLHWYLGGLLCAGVIVGRVRASGRRESGDVLTNVVFTVGLVIIAGLVLALLKSKASTVTNNICTNADPSTC